MKRKWVEEKVEEKVEEWVSSVRSLAQIAKRHLQTTYTGVCGVAAV